MTAEGKATPPYLIKGSRNAHFEIRTTVTAWDSVGSLSYFHYTGAKYGYKATLRQICHKKSENRVLSATQTAFQPTNPWTLLHASLLLPGCWRKRGFVCCLLFLAYPGAKMQCFSLCSHQSPPQTECNAHYRQKWVSPWRLSCWRGMERLSERCTLQLDIHNHFVKNIYCNCLKHYNSHFGALQPQQAMGWAYPMTCYSSYVVLKLEEVFVLKL